MQTVKLWIPLFHSVDEGGLHLIVVLVSLNENHPGHHSLVHSHCLYGVLISLVDHHQGLLSVSWRHLGIGPFSNFVRQLKQRQMSRFGLRMFWVLQLGEHRVGDLQEPWQDSLMARRP